MPMLSTKCSNPWLDQSIIDVLEVPSKKIIDSVHSRHSNVEHIICGTNG